MTKQKATSKQVIEVLQDNPTYNRAKIMQVLKRPVEHWQVQSAKRKLGLQKPSGKPRRKGRRPASVLPVTTITNSGMLTAAELIIQAEKLCQAAGSVERVKRAIDVLSEVGEI